MEKLLQTLIASLVTVTLLGFANPALAEGEDTEEAPEISLSQTSYIGARLLQGKENVQFESIDTGDFGDENSERYAFFQGDTLFAGAKNPETGNKVDMVMEWYWFESSIPRNADFYVGVVKVKSSPNPVHDWYLKKQGGVIYDWFQKEDYAQFLEVEMNPTGEAGGVRWDWCVPFDSYKWEPEKNIEVESGYSAGFDVKGGFSEGGVLKDLTDKSNIQAKGYVNGKHSVSTKYTITLYKWQMLVSSGADNIRWEMFVLPEGNNEDSAYHEYFVVIQATKGTPVYIPEIRFGGNYRQWLWYWVDNYDSVSATIKGLSFTPPPTCYVDDQIPADACSKKGICDEGAGYCDPLLGEWACNYPDEFEKEELTCDGLDNDCDGKTDEAFPKLGKKCDGDDDNKKKDGIWVCNEDGSGLYCDEDPCAGKECSDECGECDEGFECKAYQCVEKDDGEPEDPEIVDKPSYDCDGISEVGVCDGKWLLYCAGGKMVEQYCAFCCGMDEGAGYFNCLVEDQCEEPEECIPECGDKECGGDGCGGICGECGAGEACSDKGSCEEPDDETENKAYVCGSCPSGWICGANGQCIQGASDNRPVGAAEAGEEAGGCTAAGNGRGSAGAAAMLLLALLALVGVRFTRRGRRL